MMRPSPKTPEDYRARAAACERLAASATSAESHEIMHFLAMRWRDLADEAEGKSPGPTGPTTALQRRTGHL